MLYFMGGREVTIELSTTKNPRASTLDTYWTANRQALLGYMAAALKGVRGVVSGPDAEPLSAKVTVLGHDLAADHSTIVTDPVLGNYHRMLVPGTYDLRFSAEGYISQDVNDVVVGQGAAVRVDVELAMAQRLDLRAFVQDERGMPVPGALIEFLDSSQPNLMSRRSGTFVVWNLPENTYSLRLSKPGYETLNVVRTVTQAHAQHKFVLFHVHTLFGTDLESDGGGMSASGSPAPGWQWGQAASAIGAHSGSRVWATVLSQDYADNATWQLDSAPVDLLPVNPRLNFWQRYAIEAGWDGGNVKISNNGGQSYQLLQPNQAYPFSDVDALGEPGYSGSSSGWVQADFDLSAYAGQTVQLRWTFASDGSETDFGWAIDDILVTGRKATR
ncbi:MAG: carboxypeptidase regulatory-like domain-containing protein [Deltaproteobacteria bacterium]|nr:carboxypeptidase regulatory-like domain-containing protein [Deltaproteobacteria bacterium]